MGNEPGSHDAQDHRCDVLGVMASRRSVPPRHLGTPGPSSAELAHMIAAAATAPDHKGLKPYRFIAIAPHARDALAEAFVAAEIEGNPGASAQDLARAGERARHAPTLLALIVTVAADVEDVPAREQYAAAGAALGYLLLAAHALGFGAMAVSGAKARSLAVRAALGLTEAQDLMCFIAIGTPRKTRDARASLDIASLLTTWTGPKR